MFFTLLFCSLNINLTKKLAIIYFTRYSYPSTYVVFLISHLSKYRANFFWGITFNGSEKISKDEVKFREVVCQKDAGRK